MAYQVRLKRDQIRECMADLGFRSQRSFASAVEINEGSLQRFLNGYKNPGGSTIPGVMVALAEADTDELRKAQILVAAHQLGMDPDRLHRLVMFDRVFDIEKVAA